MYAYLYARGMADTTVRLDAAVRDRLATQAADRGMSLRQYVATLAEERTTAAERIERARHNRKALAEHFGVHLTEEDMQQGEDFVRNIRRHITTA